MNEPLLPHEAQRLARQILESGYFTYSRHALREIKNDGLTTVDCVNVVRAGVPRPAEYEQGEWRYTFDTSKMAVVIAFRSDNELVVVTAWRIGRSAN